MAIKKTTKLMKFLVDVCPILILVMLFLACLVIPIIQKKECRFIGLAVFLTLIILTVITTIIHKKWLRSKRIKLEQDFGNQVKRIKFINLGKDNKYSNLKKLNTIPEIKAKINQEDNTLIVLKNPDCQISEEIIFDLDEIAPHIEII